MLLRKRHRNILVFRISLLFLVVQECRGRPYDFWYGWPGPVPMPFDMSNQPMWPMVPQHKTNQKQTPVNNRAEKNFNNNRPSGVASSSSSLTPSSSSNSKHEKKNKIVSHAISRDYVNTMIDDVYGTRNPIPKDYEKNNDENLYKNTMEKPKTAPKQTTKIVTESPKEDTMSLDEKIFFPDDQPITHQSSLKKAPECNGKTYCEDAAFYPAEVVKTAVRMDNSLQNLATIDITEVVQRIDVSDDVPLCLSIEQVVYPRSAESRRKEWLYVVNQDNFRQGVRIETCLNENNNCKVFEDIAEGYKTICKQKYIYRQLAAVTPDGRVVPEFFRFPSSCCCHVTFTGNPYTRMGVNLGNQNQTPGNKSQSQM